MAEPDVVVVAAATKKTTTTTTSSSSSSSSSTTLTQSRKVKVEVWVCDVCQVEKFQDYDAACQHEEICKKRKLNADTKNQHCGDKKDKISNNCNTKNKLHPFFVKPVKTTTAGGAMKRPKTIQNAHDENTNNKNNTSTSETTKNTSHSNQQQQSKENVFQNGIPHQCQQKACDAPTTAGAVVVVAHPFFSKAKKKKINCDHDDHDDVQIVGVVKSKNETKRKKLKKSTTTITSTSSSSSNKLAATASSTDPLTLLFFEGSSKHTKADTKKLMTEQVTAEFQAKRRLQREQERERQRKRQELFHATKSNSNKVSETTATATAISSDQQQEQEQQQEQFRCTCPQFPVPNYWNYQDTTLSLPKRSYTWVREEELNQAQKILRKTLPYPGKPVLSFTADEATEFLYNDSSTMMKDHNPNSNIILHSSTLQTEFSKVLLPPTNCEQRQEQTRRKELWVNKYPLTMDTICGATNRQVANTLVEFVQEWMMERQKSNARATERHVALQAVKRNKKVASKQTKYKNDDDDMWTDIDSDDEEHKLPSVCLLEGPVGTGKTSLVYAVAQHCDCQVLELNTSDKRGSTDLRRTLQEATQSHSSLDMLKKQQASLFSKHEELVDSDDDGDIDSIDDLKKKKKKGSTLSIILIDEVDNIFESQGDTAFWSALNDLTRKARCPVFLTSNIYPRNLTSASLRFRHVKTALPSALECAQHMKRIMEKEGIRTRHATDGKGFEDLQTLMELCGFDNRRILHEMQLFASSEESPLATACQIETVEDASIGTLETSKHAFMPCRVSFESVSPAMVASSSYSVLKVQGKGFRSLQNASLGSDDTNAEEVEVFVGDQLCPLAKIVDNETILVICPPCSPPGYVDAVMGWRKTNSPIGRRSSLDAQIARLSLRPTIAAPPLSSIVSHTLWDGTVISAATACNVEYSFPETPPCRIAIASRSDDEVDEGIGECEFGEGEVFIQTGWDDLKSAFLAKKKPAGAPYVDTLDGTSFEKARQLFDRELEYLQSSSRKSHALLKDKSSGPKVEHEVSKSLERLAADLQMTSDASLLESFAGLPFLAGSSPGFGYRFTPEGSSSNLSRHGNSTQCGEEKLISLGWKDTAAFYGDSEAFFSQFVSARERKLLHVADVLGRRILSSEEDNVVLPTAEKEEETEAAYDLTMWSPSDSTVSEEDFLLHRPTPVPLLALPDILLCSRQRMNSSSDATYWDQAILDHRRDARADEQVALVDKIVSADAGPKMFCRGLHRFSPAFLPNEFDDTLFLDYMPIWRNMAVHERAASSIDPDGDTSGSCRRRATRNASKKGRSHYFETLNHVAFRWDDEQTAAQIGKRLAGCWLQYQS